MKKKKNILEEGTVRRFMRLANLNPLSENYFGEDEELYNEDEGEEEFGAEEDADAMPVDAMDDEMADAEMDATAEPEAVVPVEVATELVADIAAAVEDRLGVPIEVTGAEEEAPMEEPEVDAEEEAPMDAEEEAPIGEPDEEAPAAPYEEAVEAEGPQTITNEELVNYISQRVAKRLAEKKKE